MRAEEAIEIIERAASLYAALDTAVFAQRAREDLSLFRRQAEAPRFERRTGDVEYPQPRPEFSVPDRYRNNAELCVVFSAFVLCFVDPIGFGIYALRSVHKVAGGSEIEHVAIVSETSQEEDPEEMEILDLDRLSQDRIELIRLADEIGRGLLGDNFKVGDFIAAEVSDE